MGTLREQYARLSWKKGILFGICAAALLILAVAACCLGVADLTPGRLLVTYLPGMDRILSAEPLSPREENILLMLRLPRVAAGIVAGAGLGTAGAAMQAITGNQMASPFTTGLSGAAALGAAAVVVFGGVPAGMERTATVTAAFLMAVLCAVLVFGIAGLKGMGAEALVLTGIALNYLFSAMNSTMQFIANEDQLPAIVHWSFGSLNSLGWTDVGVMAVILLAAVPVFFSQGWAFDLMDSGGDEAAREAVPSMLEATAEDWGTEYLDYILSVKTVDSVEEAIAHINRYNTGHSEAIITENKEHAERFLREVDAAAVYVNASTRFTDGFEFGFGAEIGISTQKLHARGPMGLEALTSYKYEIYGHGQVRG